MLQFCMSLCQFSSEHSEGVVNIVISTRLGLDALSCETVFYAEIVKKITKITPFYDREYSCIFYIQDHAEASLVFHIRSPDHM